MATKSLTLWALLLAVVSTSTQTSASDADLLRVEADPPVGSRSGTEIYCVNPGDIGVNAGFGYGSEVADDIPTTLEGQSFNKVTLWVAQWLAPWVDPEGIVVNIYDEQCPPEQVAAHSYTIPWSELAPVLYGDFGFMVVYEVTALLPETHLISSTETRSIGGYVINDWGAAPPFCGFFCMEADDAPRGCAGLFWDNTTDGHPRWTLLGFPNDQVDFTYCLSLEESLDVSDSPSSSEALVSWAAPNPFQGNTAINFDVPAPGLAKVSIYESTGRLLLRMEQLCSRSGKHVVRWDGQDANGKRVPSGFYYYRVSIGSMVDRGGVVVRR